MHWVVECSQPFPNLKVQGSEEPQKGLNRAEFLADRHVLMMSAVRRGQTESQIHMGAIPHLPAFSP